MFNQKIWRNEREVRCLGFVKIEEGQEKRVQCWAEENLLFIIREIYWQLSIFLVYNQIDFCQC